MEAGALVCVMAVVIRRRVRWAARRWRRGVERRGAARRGGVGAKITVMCVDVNTMQSMAVGKVVLN